MRNPRIQRACLLSATLACFLAITPGEANAGQAATLADLIAGGGPNGNGTLICAD